VRRKRHLSVAAPAIRPRTLPRAQALERAERTVAAGGAAAAAGITTHVLPFFPTGWPLGRAAAAFATTLFSERAGLALCLALPIFPLGNYSQGLALLYGIVALAALVGFWRAPRAGLLGALGAGLGPAWLIGLLPLLGLAVRRPAMRAAGVAASVLVAGAIAGAARLGALGIPAANGLVAAGRAVGRELAGDPQLLATAAALAVAAVVLPYVRGRGPLAATGYALVIAGLTLVPAPHAPNVPMIVLTAATALALGLEPYAQRPRPALLSRPGRPVEETTAAVQASPRARAATTPR
jgi:hypothetical protein